MTLVAAILFGCFCVAAMALALASALGRVASVTDRAELEHHRTASALFFERREGPVDRRSSARPWAGASPGRRREDELRAEAEEARRALWDAEARLADEQRRMGAG
jgi:hypothetical protein